MIVLNTPHNPVGKVFTRAEIEAIANIAKEFNLLVMSDEVVRVFNPSVFAKVDAILNAVRLLVVRRRGARTDCHSSGDVGEDSYGRFCRE